MRSLIDILDFSVEELDQLIAVAKDIIANPEKYRESCKYKKLATLFFEPSAELRSCYAGAGWHRAGLQRGIFLLRLQG